MRAYRPWTDEEDAALLLAVREGATAREAAAELGRSYFSVRDRLERLGYRGRPGVPPDPYRRGRLLKLLGSGLSLNRAAREIGVSHVSVLRMARSMVAAGLLVRVGDRRPKVRYVPTE